MERTRADRIRDLQQKAEQLRARARLLARQEGQRKRALETRRRILLGACISDLMRKGDLDSAEIMASVDAYLTRPGDRAAFGLPPLPDRAMIGEA
jgi:hypothetical protein